VFTFSTKLQTAQHIAGKKSLEHLLNILTLCSRVLLEKLTVTQLVKKFPTFYETWRFITTFTRACYQSISWARSNQSTCSHPISPWSILILFFYLHLGLPSHLFPSSSKFSMHISPPMGATCPFVCSPYQDLVKCTSYTAPNFMNNEPNYEYCISCHPYHMTNNKMISSQCSISSPP